MAGSAVLGGGTVQADPVPGEVTNLRLSSGAPGELTITWDAPSDAPADYRVAWARADLSWLSWNASDETHRGNSYRGGADTSLTLTGLTGGETYKVRMRSRYNPGTSDGWSGPWTDEERQRVTAAATATPVPTAAPTPAPPSDEVTNLRLSSDASGELTITWDAPSDAPADYRVAWARADLSWLSWDASDETHRGSSYPDGADTSLTLTGLTGGETYKVRMRSRYNPGTSDGRSGSWTDEATQRVSGDAPAAPTALSADEATVKGQTSIALSWTAPSHDALTGYRIWRGADADSLNALVQDTGDTATGYSDATTEADNIYVYAVTALSLDGDSPRSATTSITRGGGGTTTRDDPENTARSMHDRVTGLTPVGGENRITISWDRFGAALGYFLQWSKLDVNGDPQYPAHSLIENTPTSGQFRVMQTNTISHTTPTNLEAGIWKVRIRPETGTSGGSPIYGPYTESTEITVTAPPTFLPPPTPTSLSPAAALTLKKMPLNSPLGTTNTATCSQR